MVISESIWNFIAPGYRFLRKNPVSWYFLKVESQAAASLLEQLNFSEIKTICDLGVGRGHSLDLITIDLSSVIALDKSTTMIQHTKKHYSNAQFLVADALNLPLKNSSFDLIICIGLVEYIPDLRLLLSQISRILKNEKFLLISFSPKNMLSSTRILSGHKIYTIESTLIQSYFKHLHFRILDKKNTPIQHQYLLKKEGENGIK